MTSCAYCGEHATEEIPAAPGRVCRTHAQEFWTGLLTYVRNQSKPTEQPETPCACGVCNDMSMVKLRMIAAGAAAGPQPEHAQPVPIAAPQSTTSHGRRAATFNAASLETASHGDNLARA